MSEDLQDFFLSCKECVLENPRNFYGCFSLGPFQNSQSLTVANALRRTLLSEIRGIAITHVEIEGVVHEYTTLSGVRESVLDILLNFKQIVLKKVTPFSKPLYGYLNVRGPGIIRVSDLQFPPIIQCVDSDQYIATLMENGKLTLKFTIEDFQNSSKNQNTFENVGPVSNFPQKNLRFPNSYAPEGESFLESSPNMENFKVGNFFPHSTPKVMPVSESGRTESSENFQKPVLFNNNKGKLFEHIPFKYVSPFGKAVDKNSVVNSDFNTNGKPPVDGFMSTSFETTTQISGASNNSKSWTPQKAKPIVLPSVLQKKSLWVDPIFNPILKVNYVIENIEPFQKNQPNQIVMIELWTNGSIHPRKALYDAFVYLKIMFEKLDSMKFLNYQFANSIFVSEKTNTKFLQSFENNLTLSRFLEKKNSSPILFSSRTKSKQQFFLSNEMKEMQKNYVLEEKEESNEILFLSLEELQLSSRILKSLRRNNFQTINDLIKITPAILKTYPGIGNFSISQIQKSLAQIGLIWGGLDKE